MADRIKEHFVGLRLEFTPGVLFRNRLWADSILSSRCVGTGSIFYWRDFEKLPLAIDRGTLKTTVAKGPTGQYVRDDGTAVDQQAAAVLFNTLTGLRIRRYIKQIEPLDDAIATITGTTIAGKQFTLTLAKRDDGVIGRLTGTLDGKRLNVSFSLDRTTGDKLLLAVSWFQSSPLRGTSY